jgi:NAD(P)-dependent dehydrogenase (short-subunit alcohol dehydrogenase family)
MNNKTAFVTGATGGIGKHIALGLARLGATVIIGARDKEKGAATRDEIIAATKNDRIKVAVVDVSSVRSVRALQLDVPQLDVQINNAGAWFSDRRTSVDGRELTLATNVIGPHLVTRALLPKLANGARVINIVSDFASEYDVSDLEFSRRPYDGMKTWGMASRLADQGITVNAVAPGFVKTDFNQNAKGFTAGMIGFMAKLFAVSPEKGADTAVWAASAPELDGVTGKLFAKRREKDGKFRDTTAIADLETKLDAFAA